MDDVFVPSTDGVSYIAPRCHVYGPCHGRAGVVVLFALNEFPLSGKEVGSDVRGGSAFFSQTE